jgi:hypothetical protein
MDTDHRYSPAASSRRISGPGELLQAVPYLLGFHPNASLVLIGLHDGRLVVTARLDLPDAAEPGVLAHTAAAMARGGSTAVVAAVYDSASDGTLPSWGGLAAAVELDAEQAGCELLEVLLVSRGRWRSLMCGSPDCCPADGYELPAAPSAFTTAATYEGVVPLPDRSALEAVLAPETDERRAALDEAIEAAEHASVAAALDGHAARCQRSVKRALFAAARASAEPGWCGPDAATVARFGVALGAIAVRDAVWMAVEDGRLDGRPLWRDLARRLPSPYNAPALFLFGWAAWRAGDGTLAGIAAERAVNSDPKYSAADLLLAAVARGVDPRQLPKLRLPRSA